METKAELRRRIRRWRRGLAPQTCRAASLRAAASLGALPELTGAHTLALYSSLPGEIDVVSVAEQALARGQRVVLPRVLGPGAMAFYPFTAETPLLPSALGVLEPAASGDPIAADALDAVVMPGLAFDRHGTRLGFGQGYYDRALAEAVRAVRIGVAFDAQVVEDVPREPHDLPMHIVVTETRIIRPSRPDER